MVTEADILRAAKFLVMRFGLYARVAAAERADKAFDKNDLVEESLWLRVMRAIASLEEPRLKTGATLH